MFRLAMLHAVAVDASARQIWSLHGSRNRKSYPFTLELRHIIETLRHGRYHIRCSKLDTGDQPRRDFHSAGHLNVLLLDQLGAPRIGDLYVCGPSNFMRDLMTGLAAAGIPPRQIHKETFAVGESHIPQSCRCGGPPAAHPDSYLGDKVPSLLRTQPCCRSLGRPRRATAC